VGPTGWADSPYQALSAFAGNGLLISLERLVEDGLPSADECDRRFPALAVDDAAVVPFKQRLLEIAWQRFAAGVRPDLRAPFEEFCVRQAGWLDDYALFRALKVRLGGGHYLDWPAELVRRRPAALDRARREAAAEVQRIRFAQFILVRQAAALRAHARASGARRSASSAGCRSSPSTGARATCTCRTTIRPAPSSTPAPTTMRRHAAGTRRCPRPSGGRCTRDMLRPEVFGALSDLTASWRRGEAGRQRRPDPATAVS